MSDLTAKRGALRPLLDERAPADAMAAYYALYHDDARTALTVWPPDSEWARGYVSVARTGMDLFRPLVTMRLPEGDEMGAVDLVYSALPEGASVLVSTPDRYAPLLHAFFEVQSERRLKVLALDPTQFTPIVNVLVARANSPNRWPRFIIRRTDAEGRHEVAASASLNWQSPHFAEVAVRTASAHRRRGWGRSVVAAMVQHLLADGRTPLYVVADDNAPSQRLAESVGFGDTGARERLIEGVLRPRP